MVGYHHRRCERSSGDLSGRCCTGYLRATSSTYEGKPRGTTPGTSIASKYISNWLNYKLPPGIRLPTLTGKTINSLQLSSTNNLGRFVGRNVPWLGWVMTFTTIYDIQRDIKDTFNRVAVPKDRIQWTYF